MVNTIPGHLDEEQIIEAIIDEAGLDPEVRRHLLECSVCRAEKQALDSKLARFELLSAEQAPMPLRKLRLSDRKPAGSKAGWKIRPSFGMGLAFASLLAVILTPHYLNRQGRDVALEKIYQEMLLDEKFMAEVENLEENPLPRFFVDVSDLSDQDVSDELHDSKVQTEQDDMVA